MLGCTNARLDLLMGPRDEPDRVFHYLPFCFAGSWIVMLTCLTRDSVLTMSTDLNKLIDELQVASPNYFLNVPALLERVRSGVEDQLQKKGGIGLKIYQKGKEAWLRKVAGKPKGLDAFWLGLAERIVFPAIRKKLGPNLKALICGSAPLMKETQYFFIMIGLPVLQVYGLTETTAICTMDHPQQFTAGRVGPAIPGIEISLGEGNEILARGPNIFPGYWNRPQETARALAGGWFHTGDQGEVDESGNWAVIGRLKNLIIPSSGHNIAPEPIEEMVEEPSRRAASGSGGQRSKLSVCDHHWRRNARADRGRGRTRQLAVAALQVRQELSRRSQPFTIENGLLTANGKLKRDAISARYQKRSKRCTQRKAHE